MASKSRTATTKRKPRKAPRKKAAPSSRGLDPQGVAETTPEAEALAAQIREDGGAALALYRDPIGGHPVVMASLPIERVEPTPYQRDRSEPHVKRLANAMERVDRFLDPMIAIRAPDDSGKYWTPNGNHRLGAAKLLGARAVMALVLPDSDVAYKILALNTEKAHNLKERSLEVIRMYRGLVAEGASGLESDYLHVFEEPVFITFGAAYEQRARFSAGAYSPVIKKVDAFLELPLDEALAAREERAARVLELDDHVSRVAEALKARGFQSAYLKNFVVARINYLRFVKGELPSFDDAMDKLLASAEKFNLDKVKREDLARMGGAPAESDD